MDARPTRRAFLVGAAATLLAPALPITHAAATPAPAAPLVPAATISWAPITPDTEYVPRVTTSPSDWLRARPDGGHDLLDLYEEVHLERLTDGQLVMIDRHDDYGSAEISLVDRGEGDDGAAPLRPAYTLSSPWPVGAEEAWDPDGDDHFTSPEEAAEAMEPGERRTLRYYTWTGHQFVYRAATGTLEPLNPASLLPQFVAPGADGLSRGCA